jgi:hypothetical protein
MKYVVRTWHEIYVGTLHEIYVGTLHEIYLGTLHEIYLGTLHATSLLHHKTSLPHNKYIRFLNQLETMIVNQ